MTVLLTSLLWLIIVIWQREQSYRMGKLDMEIHYNDALSKLLLQGGGLDRDELAGYLKALEDLTDLITADAENLS